MSQVNPEVSNEETYEALISLIENNQGVLSLILVGCDDLKLRQRVIDRYEAEARQAKIQPYRIMLGSEPSLRSSLAKLEDEHEYRRRGGEAVVTVTGAEWLLRVKLREEDQQSDLDKFFGYLQWTREALREFRYPIVLWVTHRILREMNWQAPDFWSWRKAVLRFVAEDSEQVAENWYEPASEMLETQPSNEFLPPLEELLTEIQQLESTSPESANLGTLYDKLGQVHVNRIKQGKATNLQQERQNAINAFQKAVAQYQLTNDGSASVDTFIHLGNFQCSQSCYEKAITAHQQALIVSREIGDRDGEANSLIGLGNSYSSLGYYRQAIDFHQQSLKVKREIGDRNGEATSLGNLGNTYVSIGQYQRAIDFYQQALEIEREIGDRNGESGSLCNLGNVYESLENYQKAISYYQASFKIQQELGNRDWAANSLGGLGNTYRSLGQYQRAIDFYQQCLEIKQEIGDRNGEAATFFNQALALIKYEPRRFEALTALRQAREIYAELQLEHEVERCDEAIYNFNQTIATEQRQSAPIIPTAPSISKSAYTKSRRGEIIFWFCAGITIVLLIAWLRSK